MKKKLLLLTMALISTMTIWAAGHDCSTDGHKWSKWSITDPTCTNPGIQSRSCTVCGEVESVTTEPLGHDYDMTSTTSPTCTEDGTAKFTCTRCGAMKTETIPALGHDFNASGVCVICGAKLGLPINDTNFPDAKFRAYVSDNFDSDTDGFLSDAEIAAAKEIIVYNKGIFDLKGIEFFTALETLNCGGNQLTALNVSKNTALEKLYCNESQLTALDVSKNTTLTLLECFKSKLTALNVSGCTALTILHCQNNQLTTLDVSKNTALKELCCFNNQLTALDVSKNMVLIGLRCQSNQLTALDISKNTALISLSCASNQLTTLDVSKNTALTHLWCYNNPLTTLDVSKNTALKELYCNNSQLTALNVSGCTALTILDCHNNQLTTLDVSKNTALRYLYCYDNSIRGAAMQTLINNLYDRSSMDNGCLYVYINETATANQMTIEQVAAAKAKNWKPMKSNDGGTSWVDYPGVEPGVAINATNFPDATFRTYISSSFDADNDGYLSDAEIAAVKEIDVHSKNISNLKGIEHFTALEKLECYSNQLTSLDVSQNTALKELSCSDNQLTALDVSQNTKLKALECSYNKLTVLDVSQNTALTYLSCRGNQLTSLDVSKNTALQRLSCYGNQLTSLDVSKNTALEELSCGNNQLTSLDVSKNTALEELWCYGNSIRGEAMQALVNGLCDRSSATSQGKLRVYSNETATGNEMTIPQVAAAKAKNWKVLMFNGSSWVDYPGVDPGLAIDATNFPDATFRTYISSSFDADNDGYLSDAEIAAVKKIDVSGKNISKLKGIEVFMALEELNCYKNNLTTLDVSKNTALETLTCDDNQLTALNVSKNTALKILGCSKNKLTALDVSKNTALKRLSCPINQLTAMDVSKNTALELLYCWGNQLTALDLSKNTALKYLDCRENQLIVLDVSKNKKLVELACSENGIRGAGMATLVNSLYDRSGTTQGGLYVYNNETDTGNEMTTLQVAAAKAKNWRVLMVSGDDWVNYPGVDPGPAIDATNFPDAVFRTYVSTNCDTDKDGYLSKEEIAGVKEITISNKGVTSLKGVEHFTALYYLSCYYNKLKTLDVSKNTALEYLYCYNNQLTALDVSKNTLLKNLKCYNNQLTTLDVSKNKKLTQLHCYGNAIRDDGMATLVNSLYNRASTSAGKLYVYNREPATGNEMTAAEVTSAKAKNWQVLMAKGEDWVDYPGGVASCTITLSKTEAILEKTKTLTLTATISPETLEDKTLKWKSSNTAVATVSSSGKVKGVKAGMVTITCISKATGDKATCKVTVGYVKLDKTEAILEKTKTMTLTPTVYPSALEDKSVTWKSSNTEVATVSSAGKVKGVKTGTAVITCTSNATGLSTTCTVTVPGVVLDQTEAILEKTKTMTLKATVYPESLEDKSVTWKSSKTTVATVSSTGKVKGVKAGTAVITCTSNATGLSASCMVTVGYVKLDQTEAILEKGKTMTLTPTVYPSTLTDKSVTWESSNTKVATVSSSGKVKGVKAGTATITCTSNATGLSTSCTVTVGYVKLDQTEAILEKGKTMTLAPTVYPSKQTDQSVTWESSNTEVATVASDGTVKGVKAGIATITCTSVATGLSTTCKVTVSYVKLDKSEAILEKGKTMTLAPTVYPSKQTDQSVTWKSSNTEVATVTSSGKVKGVKAGFVTITCTSNATGLSTSCTITVGYVKLDQTEAILQKGEAVTLKATVYPSALEDRSVTWESSDKTIATVTSAGKVKGVKAGTATITCTSNATGLSTTCKITVKKSASARIIDGDDEELTDIEIVETPAAEEPFDVYDLKGRKVLHQVTSLDGLSAGVYIVNGKKVLKK